MFQEKEEEHLEEKRREKFKSKLFI